MSEQIKLKSKYKKAWLKALRSGEYEQTRCDLMDDGGKCCGLGVGFDVLLDDWWVPYSEGIYKGTAGWCPQSMVKTEEESLTPLVTDWFRKPRGADEIDFWYFVDNFVQEVIDLNDDNKISLGGIADYIEKNY